MRTLRLTVALGVLLSALAVGGASAAQPSASASPEVPTEAFVVAVQQDGDATITLRLSFDLTTDAERQAFDRLRANESYRSDVLASFTERIRAVAANTQNVTGREMTVTNPRADIRTTNDGRTGIVALTVTWTNLAAVDGDHLVLTEPFAGGFSPDRAFVVRAPDGYTIDATPQPSTTASGVAVWTQNQTLDGFRAALLPADASGTETTTGATPGLGIVVALIALAASALLRLRE